MATHYAFERNCGPQGRGYTALDSKLDNNDFGDRFRNRWRAW